MGGCGIGGMMGGSGKGLRGRRSTGEDSRRGLGYRRGRREERNGRGKAGRSIGGSDVVDVVDSDWMEVFVVDVGGGEVGRVI